MRIRKRHCWLIVFLVCLGLSSVYLVNTLHSGRGNADQDEVNINNMCGPYCLTSIFQYFGNDIQMQDILPVISSQQGSSILELKKIAEAYDFKTLGVKTDGRSLFVMRRPAILHVNGNHFIALLPDINSSDYIVIDAPETYSISTFEEFDSKWDWDGICLYIDKDEIPLDLTDVIGTPKLYVENADYDAGVVYDGQNSISHTFLLRNTGNKDLIIEDFKTGCSCTFIEDEKIIIKSNEVYPLDVQFRLSQKVGQLPRQSIVVISNDPQTPHTKLSISVERKKEFVISPRVIQFGILKDTEKKSILFKVTSENLVKRLLCEKICVGHDFIKVENVGLNKINDSWEYLFRIDLLPDAPYGYFTGEITVDSSGSICKQISIPISGEVASLINLSKSKVVYGLIDVKKTKRIFKTIEAWSEVGFSISSVSSKTQHLSITSEMINANKYILNIELNPSDLPKGAFSDEIVLCFKSKKDFKVIVPITGYIF